MMKKFFECLIEWKTAAAYMFSGSVVLCTVIMIFLGESAIPVPVIISMLIVSSVGTFLQYLAFTDRFIKRMPYSIRTLVFAVPFFALLAGNAFFFLWFPMDTINWLLFVVIYVVVLAVMMVGFEIYFKMMGKKYDGLLGQYRKQKELKRDD